MPRSIIEIDLDAIAHNVRVVRGVIGQECALCAVLKADAYGLGALRIAKRIASVIGGPGMIGVYDLDEAREFVNAAVGLPILVLSPVRALRRDDRLYRFAATGDLHLTAHDPDNLEAIASIADGLGVTLPVHVEVDTGMARGGASPADARHMLARAHQHRRLRVAGLFTHYARAETDAHATDAQRRTFDEFVRNVSHLLDPDCLVHAANTHGVFRGREHHRGMVRVGLGLFGYADRATDPHTGEHAFPLAGEARDLRPAFRWASGVTHLRTVEPGTSVGYGSTWTAQKTTTLALVPVGYADGYPLALGNAARAGVVIPREGQQPLRAYAPVVGAVSMDQILLDVTHIPGVELGTRVELISDNPAAPNALHALAHAAGTIPYDLMCRLSARIERTYHLGAMPEITPVLRPHDRLARTA
ncbi:MAG: alanine racemase [Phycisphaerales bacterium]